MESDELILFAKCPLAAASAETLSGEEGVVGGPSYTDMDCVSWKRPFALTVV